MYPNRGSGPVGRWAQLMLLLVLLGAACQRPVRAPEAAPVAQPGVNTLVINGEVRRYHLHLPPDPPNIGMALLVSLHGLGGSAEEQERLSGASELADREGFAVIYPEGQLIGRQMGWITLPDSEDVLFLRTVVATLQDQLNLDPGRIYLTGHSNGGGMVHRLMCDAADLFAAASSVAGAYLYEQPCEPSQPIGLIAFHSRDDSIVPYEGSAQTPELTSWAAGWAERNGCEPIPKKSSAEAGAQLLRWSGCAGGVEVLLYTLDGVGHRWPGGPGAEEALHASETMWAFFASSGRR